MDVTELGERLLVFCRAHYGGDVEVHEIEVMPGHAGFAFGFAVRHDGTTERWFLRVPPPNVRWVGTADMLRQVTALQALDGGPVPHCRVRWFGGPDDLEWFGTPYFVVEQLQGGDVVTYSGGRSWTSALTQDRRDDMARQAMVALAQIHRVDWQERCTYLGAPVAIEDDVHQWDRFVDRCANPELLTELPALKQMLLDRLPQQTTIGLRHGDYQLGNLYFSPDGELRAVLDWELCGIGATLADVGWVATFNDPPAWNHEGAVPPQMPGADELVAAYVEASGESVDDIAWFRALAAYKFTIITGFNLSLHLRGKRPDPLWERIGQSMGSLQARAFALLDGTPRPA